MIFFPAAADALLFIYLLRPFNPYIAFILYAFFHMPAVTGVGFKNKFGRTLLYGNIAGAAFMSEALCLYLVHNNIMKN
jgi:hypothetical protein